ncbi:MAG: hypothetical protein SF052_26825 [Bacteroidia bacterium]|nr:hypothetical protein [Bacteroidia bacterium]
MNRTVRKYLSILFQLAIMVAAPFFLIIRGSVYLYEYHHWYHWLAILLMFLLAFGVVLIYLVMIWSWLTGIKTPSRKNLKTKAWIAAGLLAVYGGYTLVNLSGSNAKTEKVRKEFSSLHPLLRMSVGTLLMLDSSVLITDMSRVKEDYKTMGLKEAKNSLHYKQKDGYVHAMDLRTKGHGFLRNKLLQGYFILMGFNTLRHYGTADHLHVSLTAREKPGVI